MTDGFSRFWVPGEQDLPPPDLMLQELTGVEQLPEMAAETVDLILGENGAIPGEFPLDQELGGIEMAPLDVQMPEGGLVEDLLPHTTEKDTTVTDKGLGNEPSLTEEEMMKPTEETPAVMIDPGALWVEDGPQQRPPASPGVTPTQPPVDKRARLRANLSLNLSPIVHADTPRTKRRKQLLFADNVIQIPQQRLKHQVQNGQETCKRMEYPQPHASRSQNLFTRPYNRLIQRNPRLLALWTHNTRTHPVTEPSESDIEYPIWTVPELGADTSSSGSSERGAEGPTDPHISEEEFIYEEPVPQPDLGVSITALREASVSHIELPRDASLRDVSEHGLVSDVTSLHASLLSRSDTPHTLNVTAEPQTESAHKSAQMQQAATSIEELWDEPTLMLGEQFTLHDIPENGELPAPPGDVTLDSSSLKPLFVPGPAVSPIPDRPPVSPRLEEGLETVPPEVENGVQEEPPADPKVPSPLPHHQLMKLIKKTTRKQQSVTFHEVCPPTIKNRDQAARLFTALLDLCALQRLSVKQEAPYADIYISKGRKWTNPAAPPAIL